MYKPIQRIFEITTEDTYFGSSVQLGSLTSIIGKILESLVRDAIVEHMSTRGLFCDAQHGFVPGRSCITQLLIVMEHWTKAIDEGVPVDAVYLDFQKAFDTVPHERLLRKLSAYGIRGQILDWIRDFLSYRRQRVIINGTASDWTSVLSGIPQGSVLGPTLFVCFINDLPTTVSSTIQIFADDTKIYRTLRNYSDFTALQDDLTSLKNWSDKWQLHFNASKCKILHLGYNNLHHSYQMGESELEITRAEKDLGVFIDDELKFHHHINIATNKANKILGLIRHTFNNLDIISLPLLYKTLVRPHLEYANVIWNPRFAMDIAEVEKVQRRATKLIPQLSHLPYEERLKFIGLPSLKYRRLRFDMIQLYKILTNKERLDPDIFFELHQYSATRGHTMKLRKPRARTSLRSSTFSHRVINTWNALPQYIINASTTNIFKGLLDNHLSNLRFST